MAEYGKGPALPPLPASTAFGQRLARPLHQVAERDVLVTAIPNMPGSFAPVLRLLSGAGINIDHAYGGGSEGAPSATVVIGVEDAARASAAAGI